MERKMRRSRQQLSQETCEAILLKNNCGTLSLNGDDGYPYGVPMNYLYLDGKLIFHGGNRGYRIDCMRRDPKASFCVIDLNQIVPEEYTSYFRSVIARGTLREVTDKDEVYRLIDQVALSVRTGFPEERAAAIDKELPILAMFVMDIEEMTGKEAIELVRAREAE